MACLFDTNILVYRFDPRDPEKQQKATHLLREKLANREARIPHQAIVEFIAATTRPLTRAAGSSLLDQDEAAREAEEWIAQFPIIYPKESVLRIAIQGWSAYHLSWFDAHLWAYAEYYGIHTIYSEDFQHGRLYGSVRVINPFITE